MQDLNNIKSAVSRMSKVALNMWALTHRAFMEHDLDLITTALAEENIINDAEKDITKDIIELAKSPSGDKLKNTLNIYANITQDLELIGDYCKDILERVQIKIEEKLLFSEEGVREYNELYDKTTQALEEVVFALDKDKPNIIKDSLKQQGHIDSLVDEYRQHHNERLIRGACAPFACNMFLNMLDFTAAVYYHTKKIARSLSKIK